MAVFVTSDHHFGHANIIRYCDRPFSSVEEMDMSMALAWNRVVSPGDLVYHLGDFALGPAGSLASYRSLLHGEVVLLKGNHDTRKTELREVFGTYHTDLSIRYEDRTIEMCHFPENLVAKARKGAWCLHGHSHGRYDPGSLPMVDVSVDAWDFEPVPIEELARRLGSRR